LCLGKKKTLQTMKPEKREKREWCSVSEKKVLEENTAGTKPPEKKEKADFSSTGGRTPLRGKGEERPRKGFILFWGSGSP